MTGAARAYGYSNVGQTVPHNAQGGRAYGYVNVGSFIPQITPVPWCGWGIPIAESFLPLTEPAYAYGYVNVEAGP